LVQREVLVPQVPRVHLGHLEQLVVLDSLARQVELVLLDYWVQ